MSNEAITITVKHTVHKQALAAVTEFFEVTAKRARAMITSEIQRHGMTGDSVFAVGQSDGSLAYEICDSLAGARELAKAYTNHMIISLATGKRFAMRAASGKGNHKPEFVEVDEVSS
jgi:hypothetical protein